MTYEEALAAFENSPRRKRAVRGNSVSDHAPKPEDFKRIDVTEGAEEDTFASEASEETYSGSRRSRRVARKQGETRKAVENPTQSEAADDTDSTGNVKIDSLRGSAGVPCAGGSKKQILLHQSLRLRKKNRRRRVDAVGVPCVKPW